MNHACQGLSTMYLRLCFLRRENVGVGSVGGGGLSLLFADSTVSTVDTSKP